MRKTVKLPNLTNVAIGATSTLNIPVGPSYDQIVLEYSGMTLAQLQNIDLQANGKSIQFFNDGAELEQINDYYGRDKTAGILTFWFIRPEMARIEEQRMFTLGTADISTLTMTLDIAAAAAGPVTLNAHAVQSERQPAGLITKIKRFPLSFSAAGQQEIDSIPRGNARIGCIHFIKTDVNDIEVEMDSVRVFDATKTLAQKIQRDYGRVPAAGATQTDFMLDGDFRQALITQGIQDFRLRPTLGAAGATPIVVEYLDALPGI